MQNKLKELLPFLPWACSLTFLTPNFSTLSCSYILHDEEPHSKFCNQYALTCNCQNWIFKQQITTKIIYHCCLNTKAQVSLTMMQVMTGAMWPSNQIRGHHLQFPQKLCLLSWQHYLLEGLLVLVIDLCSVDKQEEFVIWYNKWKIW